MKYSLYADDFESAEHLLRSVETAQAWEMIETSEQLEGVQDSFVIVALDQDVRRNESLLRHLISRENRILLLQRVPTLEAAKFYLSLGVRGYGNAMMHRVYFDAACETIRSEMIWLHPEITARLVLEVTPHNDRTFMEHLSEREREIAIHLLEGKTNHEIADLLAITPRTVKAHASHIYHKLQVKDRLDFALRYR